MAHTVSREIAEKLKEAGYPQPDHIGSVYWARFVNMGFSGEGDLIDTADLDYIYKQKARIIAYAPPLGELIRELPDHYFSNNLGEIYDDDTGKLIPLPGLPDSPEDACALCWMELQKSNTKK